MTAMRMSHSLARQRPKNEHVAKAWCDVLVVGRVVVTTGFVAENLIGRERCIGVDHQPSSPQSDQGSYYGMHQDSKRTRLIHRPYGDIAPPVGGIHVSPVGFYCEQLAVR
jgi:hypothetical protein